MGSAITYKKQPYTSYYYNFHHFRWKKCQFLISTAGMEAHNTSTHYYTNYTPEEKGKHKSFRRQRAEPLMTFASFILMVSTLLVITSNRFVHCQGKLTVTDSLELKDSSRPSSRSVPVRNCFSLERKKSWPRAITYNNSTASVNIDLNEMDQSVIDCLRGKEFNL